MQAIEDRRVAAPSEGTGEVRWPTPHELRAFVRLAETLHFGRTAAMLGLAQSSLSEAIRRLEDKLGAVLLERTSRHVSLTDAGERLLPVARSVLVGLAAARTAVDVPAPTRGDTLRIGIEGVGLAELNGAVLDAVVERHPRVRLIVRESLGPSRAFVDQRLDLAVVRSPADDALAVHPVATEPRGLIVPVDHPATRCPTSMRDVCDEPFVAVAPRSPATRDYWLALDQRDGRAPVIGGAAHTLQEMVSAVGHLGLITTGCPSLVRSHPVAGVEHVPMPDLPPNVIGIAVRRDEARPAVLGLVKLMREVVAALAAQAPGITAVP